MHLQQTKKGSIKTGGPQYYFHDLTDPIKTYLRAKGAVRVALVTPYGATKSDYYALGKDHKFDKSRKVVKGTVGHDRIQQGYASESIGEAIRKWYKLAKGNFDRIDVDIEVIEDVFYLTPLKGKFAHSKKETVMLKIERPLTFSEEYISPLWKNQIIDLKYKNIEVVRWSLEETCRVVTDHRIGSKVAHIQESDILRASGPLRHLGVTLGAYVGKGYDCISAFNFLSYPSYQVPVEVKKHSKNFSYQQKKYGKDELSRAVILCAFHDLKNIPKNIDVIELQTMRGYLKSL
jgi:hypothetical protein